MTVTQTWTKTGNISGPPGEDGQPGLPGAPGTPGPPGPGIAIGGMVGDYLTKASTTDYDTVWSPLILPENIVSGTGLLNQLGFWTAEDTMGGSPELALVDGVLSIDRGPGAGVPLMRFKTNNSTQIISSDGSSYMTFSNGISVPMLFTQGLGFTTVGAQVDMNGGSIIQAGKFTVTGSTGHVRNYSDYNAGQGMPDQGIIHTYANRQVGADVVAFQAHKAGDISEQPFKISSWGYGHLINGKPDKPVLLLKAASGQTVSVFRVEGPTGTPMVEVDASGALKAHSNISMPGGGILWTATDCFLYPKGGVLSSANGMANLRPFAIGEPEAPEHAATKQYVDSKAPTPESDASSNTDYGVGASATGGSATAIGAGATSPSANGVAIGKNANSSADSGVVIGSLSSAAASGVTIGYNARSPGGEATAIGMGADASGNRSVAIGKSARAITATSSAIAIGVNSKADASYALAIGAGAQSAFAGSAAIGVRADGALSAVTTQTNQIVLGTSAHTVDVPGTLRQQGSGLWKAWTGTQAAYDAIVTKDANTLYVVV